MRTRLLVCLCAVAVAACISCDNTIYRIEMTPHGDQMTRQLDMTRNEASSKPVTRPLGSAATQPYEGAFPGDVIQHIADQYKQGSQVAENEVAFLGEFTNKLPDDVGNLGHYHVFTDQLGSANVYLEQFRGHSDQVPNAMRVLESAGTLADLIGAYLRQNLSHDPAWPAFEPFLKSGFREDMHNLALNAYIVRAAGTVCQESSPELEGMLMRMWQFLIEHGYSSLDDLPAFKPNQDSIGPNILQRLLGRKMGIPADQWEKRLAFLAYKEKVGTAFLASVEGQESYKQWKQRKLAASQPASGPSAATQAAATQPAENLAPDVFMNELVGVIVYGPGTPDELALTMALPQKPLKTNGQWDSAAGKVKWSASMPLGENPPLPVICYAIWSEPNVDFQQQHLGRLVLQGQELYEYVFWTKTLSKENARQWEQLLEKLTPEDAVKKLEGFRFRDDPKMTAATPSQPATMPAGKAAAWTQKIAEAIIKYQQGSSFDRTLE